MSMFIRRSLICFLSRQSTHGSQIYQNVSLLCLCFRFQTMETKYRLFKHWFDNLVLVQIKNNSYNTMDAGFCQYHYLNTWVAFIVSTHDMYTNEANRFRSCFGNNNEKSTDSHRCLLVVC